MQSIILVTSTDISLSKFIEDSAKKESISKEDILIFDPFIDETEKKTKSIGIGRIKDIQHQILLKPLGGNKKLVVIKQAHLMTNEAQNAMLKTLEEPPESTQIILVTDNKENLLPTICSRCEIIELKTTQSNITSLEKEKIEHILINIKAFSVGEKLLIAQEYGKTKEEALNFLEKLITVARGLMIESLQNTTQISYTLSSLQKTHTIIKTTNVSPRLNLEALFLSL